jgi:hypothetical protein
MKNLKLTSHKAHTIAVLGKNRPLEISRHKMGRFVPKDPETEAEIASGEHLPDFHCLRRMASRSESEQATHPLRG